MITAPLPRDRGRLSMIIPLYCGLTITYVHVIIIFYLISSKIVSYFYFVHVLHLGQLIILHVNRSCTAQFLAKGFSGNCGLPFTEASHQKILCSCYQTSRVHQTALPVLVHVGKIEAQNHGNIINN